MKQNQFWVKLFTIVILLSSFAVVNAATTVTGLLCEYHENPIGIEVQKPRLSWKINATETSILQIAYEIKVTEQPGKGKTIWNSGKINSGQSVNVEYGGPVLQPMQRVYWQVRVWDNNAKASAWSQPAFWEMGLTDPTLWKAS